MTTAIRRTILAAAFGLFGGSAFAQSPAPVPVVAAPILQAQPAPIPMASAQMAPAMAAPMAAPVYGGVGGCSSECAPTAASKRIAGRVLSPFLIGEGCANPVSCGSFASERTFLFGSCKQFFNPGNKCGLGFGHGGCAAYPLGTGGLGNHNTCEDGTAVNR